MAKNNVLPSIDEVSTDTCTTTIRAHLLQAWAHAASDPGERICEWLTKGAPAGLTQNFSALDTIFPRVNPQDKEDFDDLTTDHDGFINYSGVEEDDEAASLIKDYADKDYLEQFDSLEEVRRYVGGDPVVSKLGIVVKWVWNPTMHEWKKKVRII